ncbi:MAG: TIR domain-containing protein [Chloroflexi bacterium]|nr:TIR domain-containing protein [Chloroflexota bacterium]
MTDAPTSVVRVFYSYAHKDEALLNTLKTHLSSLRREGLIEDWHDRDIVAGTEWEREIDHHIHTADMILLLVSADFISSDYCYGIEMMQAMKRHDSGQARVIPIILRPVDWQRMPFGKLQALPTSATPVTTWSDQEAAFVHIIRDIRRAIGDFPSWSTQLDPTRFPNGSIRYFLSLKEFLKLPGRRFPTEQDFAQHLVYLSERHVLRITSTLQEKRRVLLYGPSASGKTVLAIALAKQLQDTENYKVAYNDASRAKEGDGQHWYELMSTHDRERILYILDNCHLAANEVNEFCFQWEGRPPQHAQCILISRGDQAETINNYFDACSNERIRIRAKDLYWGIAQKYAVAYRQQAPERYVALEEDSAELLEKQHAHNLVISKSRLETWRVLGGRLSSIKQESVYEALKRQYLSRGGEALAALCVLRQYEIRAHNIFVETKLPLQEVEQLEREHLLTSVTLQNYGLLYNLVFHPAEACEVLKAYVYRKNGIGVQRYFETEVIHYLQLYLQTAPINYVTVYENLAHQGQSALLRQLLTDRSLQECAVLQFDGGSVFDTVRYIHMLAEVDTSRACELLTMVVNDVTIQAICSQIKRRPVQDVEQILLDLQKIHCDTAQRVAETLASDIQQLIQRSTEKNLQRLFWLLRALKGISPNAAHRLLDSLAPAGLASLCRSREADVGMVQQFRKVSTQTFWRQFLREFSPQDVADLFQRSSLGEIGTLLEHGYIPWQRGYDLFRQQTLKNRLSTEPLVEVGKFIHRVQERTPHIARDALDLLITCDLSERIASANLQQLALLIQNAASVDRAYALHLLPPLAHAEIVQAAIVHSDIEGIQKLLYHLAKLDDDRQYASSLHQALQNSDLTDKFEQASLKDLARLLWNVYTYIERSLAQTYYQQLDGQTRSEQLRKADLDDLSLFLWNLTSISSAPSIHTLDNPVIKERFTLAWQAENTQALVLLGIVTLTRPAISWQSEMSSCFSQEVLVDWLATRLTEQNPYTLALTLRGLRLSHKAGAQDIMRQYMPLAKAKKFLNSALEQAVTLRSVTLLTEELAWIEKLEMTH